MAFSSTSNYDWQRPTSFSQPPADGDDSFSSLKSYLEFFGDASVNSMNPASLSHSLMGHDGQQQQQPLPADESASSRSASPQSNPGAQGNKDEQQQSHTKRKGAAEGDLDVEALKDRRSGHRDAAVHHTHGANAEPSDAAAAAASQKKDNKKRAGGANTSEKRKEQNRNAQRAFRERREKYARELEDKLQAMTEVADARQAENNSLKELIAQLQTENARRATSGRITEPIPALANSSFTFNLPNPAAVAASSSDDSQDGNTPPTPPSAGLHASSSAGSVPASAHLAFDSLFSQAPAPAKSPLAPAAPASSSSVPSSKPDLFFPTSAPQPYESFTDPVLGSYSMQNFTSQPSPMSSGRSQSGLLGSSSSGLSPFAGNPPPLTSPSELFNTHASEFNPYGSFEELFNNNSTYTGTLQPFESQSPAATFDAPTPSSDLFANYREPSSASLFGEPVKSASAISPPPALAGTASDDPQGSSAAQRRHDSTSSAVSTRSTSTFNGSSSTPGGESSCTSSPPSAHPDKPSPASFHSANSYGHQSNNNNNSSSKIGAGAGPDPCAMREQLNALRGSEAFDMDALCQDMAKKATCKENMRLALDHAAKEDLDVFAVFRKIGAEKHMREAYML